MATGKLTNQGQHDWLVANLTAGDAYVITVTGLTASGSVLVGDASDLLADQFAFGLPSAGEAPGNTPISVFFEPTATGPVYIDVSDEGSASIGYTVTASQVSPDYAGNASTTGVLAPDGSLVDGTLAYPGQHDWLRLTLAADEAVEVTATSATADIQLAVGSAADLAPGGPASQSVDYGAGAGGATRFFEAPAAGVYYVDVSSIGATGAYAVSATQVATDYTDNPDRPASVAVGGTATIDLTHPNQDDWIAASLTAGRSYLVTLTGDGGSAFIAVGDAAGLNAFKGGVGSPRSSATALFEPGTTGVYYIDASDDGATGPQTVSLQAVATDHTDNVLTSGTLAADGIATEGTLSYAGQIDWLAVQLAAGQAYEVMLTPPTDGAAGTTSADLEIGDAATLDDFGIEQSTSNASEEFAAGNVGYTTLDDFFRPQTAGTYYVRVQGSPGSYDVAVAPVTTDVADNPQGSGIQQPGSITVGGSFTGTLTHTGQVDWVAVSLVAGEAYEVTLAADGSEELEIGTPETPGALDSGLLALGELGGYGLEAEPPQTPAAAGSGGTSDSLFFRATATQTYYIAVQAVGSYGGYTLGVQDVTATTDTTSGAVDDTATTDVVSLTPYAPVGYAKAVATLPAALDFGQVHAGTGAPFKTISIADTAPPPAEDLDATVTLTGPAFTLIGATTVDGVPTDAITGIQPGTPGTSDLIFFSTGSDGLYLGAAKVVLASDGAGTDGDAPTPLPTQTVALSGTVFAYAAPSLGQTTLDLGAARVGDAPPASSLTISNGTSPDAFQEGLQYSFADATSPFTLSGDAADTLAAGGTSSVGASLDTSVSGTFSDTLAVSLTSNGSGVDSLGATPLAAQSISLSGTVYAPAVPLVATASLGFGVVHVGDAPPAQDVVVKNTGSGALVDDLVDGDDAVSPGFSEQSFLGAVSAGGSGTIAVALDTQAAGVFSGTDALALASHDDRLADLALTTAPVTLSGTVDNYATAALTASGGVFTPDGSGGGTLNLGTLMQGDSGALAAISVQNVAGGPADLLSGSFTADGGAGFMNDLAGVGGLGAGASALGGYIGIDTSEAGSFSETVTFDPTGSNSSGYSGALAPETVVVTGDVVAPPPPAPPEDPAPITPAPPTATDEGTAGCQVSTTDVNFGNVALGSKPAQSVTITNAQQPAAADEPPLPSLDAGVTGTTGDATASGMVTALGAGKSSGAISVGIDTSSLGPKSGTVTIACSPDGSPASTTSTIDLPFASTGQSIFGLGTVMSAGTTVQFSSIEATTGGPLTTSIGGVDITANGTVSNVIQANIGGQPGTADIEYPVMASVSVPDAVNPGGVASFGGDVAGEGAISLSSYLAPLGNVSLEDDVGFELQAQASVPALGIDTGLLDTGAQTLTFQASVGPSTPVYVPPAPFNNLSLSLPATSISTESTITASTPNALPDLVATGAGTNFLSATGDILPLIAGPEAEALDPELPDPNDQFQIAGLDAGGGVALEQDVVFHPTGIMVTLTPSWDPANPTTEPLGIPIDLDVPASLPIGNNATVVASYALDGTLDTQTGLQFQLTLALDLGTLKISDLQLLGVGAGTIKLGPLASVVAPPLNLGDLQLFNSGSFDVGGFAPITKTYVIPVQAPAAVSPAPTDTHTVTVEAVVSKTGGAWGDTHVTTFDGLHYGFQAAGEFVFAKNADIDVQVRLEPTGGAQNPTEDSVSFITATAIGIGANRLTFDFSRADPFWLNGAAAELGPTGALTLSDGTTVTGGYGSYVVTAPTGESVTVGPATTSVSLDSSIPTTGLLASDDGSALEIDGTPLPASPTYQQFYGDGTNPASGFAGSQRVVDPSSSGPGVKSLFDYGPGESTATFTNLNFPPAPVTLASLPAAIVTQAEAAVAAAGIADPADQQSAALDYVLAGADPTILAGDVAATVGDTSKTTVAPVAAPGAPAPEPLVVTAGPGTTTTVDGAPAAVTFGVSLTAPAPTAVTVDYTLAANGAAGSVAASEYGGAPPSGSVTIAQGATAATFMVDTPTGLVLPSEDLQLAVSTPTAGVALANAVAGAPLRSAAPVEGDDASPLIVKIGGPGTLEMSDGTYILALGTIAESAVATVQLAIANAAGVQGDTLGGALSTAAGTTQLDFNTTGLGDVGEIAPGANGGGFTLTPIDFAGRFVEDFTFAPTETNVSGYSGTLAPLTLVVTADVTAPAPACFAAGTRIATERGAVAVEDLAVGDLIRTASGELLPAIWIGRRRVDCAAHPRPLSVMPMRVRAHAFARNQPSRDLLLSPDHAVFAEGVLIPVKRLENGAGVRQIRVESIEYWHVELPRHAILLAEGLPAESYLETGQRAAFDQPGSPIQLHPDFARADLGALIWDGSGCAPLVVAGPEVDAARLLLASRERRRAAHAEAG